MPTAMMDKRDAWVFLADLWSHIDVDSRGIATPDKIGYLTCTGLCPCITALEELGEITKAEELEMKETILKLPIWIDQEGLLEDNSQGYRWAPDAEGAKQRVAFCLEQAKNC